LDFLKKKRREKEIGTSGLAAPKSTGERCEGLGLQFRPEVERETGYLAALAKECKDSGWKIAKKRESIATSPLL
jgi:hypothetical protein